MSQRTSNSHTYRSSNQFFKPTKFQEYFELTTKFEVAKSVGAFYADSLATAEGKVLRELNAGTRRFSLSAEPGTGKTTVLPFRFSAKVCVVLPTAFDAWSAYKTASEPANLYLLDRKESNKSNVTYTDSYMAAHHVLKGSLSRMGSIVIIDESDSNAGITKFLTELELKDFTVVLLSGTPDSNVIRTTSSFPVEHIPNLPHHSQFDSSLDYISVNSVNSRSLVMAPDADTASKFASSLLGSKLIGAATTVDDLDEVFDQQLQPNQLIVTDDSCSRGFNLNLDKVFDFAEVKVSQEFRSITLAEKNQRSMRVGRLKSGSYHFFEPEQYAATADSQHDIFRNNVARAVFGLPLKPCDMELDKSSVSVLALSEFEPYLKQIGLNTLSRRTTPSSVSSRRGSRSSTSSSSKKMPGWVLWAAGLSGASSSTKPSSVGDHVSVVRSRDKMMFVKPMSSPKGSVESAALVQSPVRHFASKSRAGPASRVVPVRRTRPDPVDLSLYDDHVDWPSALTECYESGELLPLVIPRQGWRYTTTGSGGLDHVQRLVGIIEDGPKFSKAEFEAIARGWNVLVSRQGFSLAGRADVWNDSELLVFCLEYFSNYVQISD